MDSSFRTFDGSRFNTSKVRDKRRPKNHGRGKEPVANTGYDQGDQTETLREELQDLQKKHDEELKQKEKLINE